jgi:hypothetical protein
MTDSEIFKKWCKRNNVGGTPLWFTEEIHYQLTEKQIIAFARHLKKVKNEDTHKRECDS